MLACSPPPAGQHHDLSGIRQVSGELRGLLKEAGIEAEGLFLNADAGFGLTPGPAAVRRDENGANIGANPRSAEPTDAYVYFGEELSKRRVAIEGANAWLGSFKALLVRFETKAQHWWNLHFLAFAVQLIRKINQTPVY
jgi:hypothetical protein